jgi:hypothetical protein
MPVFLPPVVSLEKVSVFPNLKQLELKPRSPAVASDITDAELLNMIMSSPQSPDLAASQ